jgi:NAD-reducing hydrogenase small subunit
MTRTTRPRIATAWLGGCSGCHMSFLDLDESLLDLAARADIVTSPLVDTKDFEPVDIALVEGAVANSEHVRQIREIRRNTKVLVAFGDCAVTGNVTALRNTFGVEDVLDRAYRQTSELVVGMPRPDEVMPALLDRVRPVHELVEVDHFLPGCPPPAAQIRDFLWDLLDEVESPRVRKRFG